MSSDKRSAGLVLSKFDLGRCTFFLKNKDNK